MNYEKGRKKRHNDELNAYDLDHLSDRDLLFLIENYVTKRQDYEHIADLVRGDVDIVSKMVDSDRVFEKVMREGNVILHSSPYFLFTLLLRRVFKLKKDDGGFINDVVEELNSAEGSSYSWNRNKVVRLLNSADVPNYLANMLSTFVQTSRLYKMEKDEENQYRYISDMIEEIQRSDSARRFYIYCHIGNYTLFFTGMFSEYIEHKFKYKKTLVNSRYYADFGKTYFGLASEHVIARQHELNDTLHSLSEGFEIITKLLQYMRKEYLALYNLK
ncbi:MAG: hypothetical protein NG747_06220 [Candidatus Brocadia sp.]|nr:hypothetical protein [Candidatus Brocadia sp.]